jgi:hypothetical protein
MVLLFLPYYATCRKQQWLIRILDLNIMKLAHETEEEIESKNNSQYAPGAY